MVTADLIVKLMGVERSPILFSWLDEYFFAKHLISRFLAAQMHHRAVTIIGRIPNAGIDYNVRQGNQDTQGPDKRSCHSKDME